jgi:hypothetical protein
MAALARGLKWTGIVVLTLALGAAALLYVLIQTGPGHDFLLRTALQQLPRFVNGEVEIRGIRSDGLLRGVTLQGVSIRDDRGRPFAEIDSVQVRYSARDLLNRDIVLVPARMWGPHVTIEALAPDSVLNVTRIFAPDAEPDPDAPPPAVTLALREIEISGGTFTLRLPLDGEDSGIPGGVVESVEGVEGTYQVIRLTQLDARISEALILDPGREGEWIDFERLAFTGEIFESPILLSDFRGVVERTPEGVSVVADRIWLAGTEMAGRVELDLTDPEGLGLDVALEVPVLSFADFRWLIPGIPEGEGSVNLTFTGRPDQGELRLLNADLRVGDSRVQGSTGIDLLGDDGLRLSATRLQLLPFDLDLLDPWLTEPLPRAIRLTGDVEAEGALDALRVQGDLVVEERNFGELPIPVSLAGILHIGDDVGASDLAVSIDPLEFRSLAAYLPEVPVEGTGRLEVLASGALRSGIELDGFVEHAVGGGAMSRIDVAGTVEGIGGDLGVGLNARFTPLSLDGVAMALSRELPLSGVLTGEVRADGMLTDLDLSGRIETSAGLVDGRVRMDVTDPFRGYVASGSVEDFRVHMLIDGVPDSTVITGEFAVDGAGGTLELLAGSGSLELRDSWVAGLPLEQFVARARASGGRLVLDELELASSVITLSGTGELPLREGEPDGEIRVEWDARSLAALRPFLFGEEPIVADTLTVLERQILVMEGVDLDTLVASGRVELDGRVHGDARIRGGVGDLRGEGMVAVEDFVYDGISLGLAEGGVALHWQDGGIASVEASAGFEDLAIGDFQFASGRADVAQVGDEGSFDIGLHSEEGEVYEALGSFTRDSVRVEVALEEMRLDLQDVQWSLGEPATVRVEGSRVEVVGFRVMRPQEGDSEPVAIQADGVIDLDGESDLSVRVEGVDLERLAQMAQVDGMPSGFLFLDLTVQGPPESPVILGDFEVHDFAYNTSALSSVTGVFEYHGDRRLRTRVTGVLDEADLLTVDGTFPVDLSFHAVESRLPQEEMDIAVSIERLPAATVLGFLEVLDEISGMIDADVRLRGTPGDLRPSGNILFTGGSALISEIGIRATGIDTRIQLREDGTLQVNGVVQSRGTARIAGTIDMSDITDPGFALQVTAAGFQAVDRRDMSARVAGDVRLGGSYSAPFVEGSVLVEQGELFLEEFARTAEVIDLTDPAFFDVVDTSFVAGRPAVEAAQNPFIQNLRVDVEMALQNDFWLRSREINVEISGDLSVAFDRRDREIVLVGTLEPVRGTYATFGRQFQVEGGSVDFAGTPGINPALNINAVTRLRRQGGEPLAIFANVGGTLMNPRVRLSTDAQPPIAESDLISYLLFGRPSYALASAETTTLEGALGAGVSRVTGSLAAQLGTVVGRQIGFDYFNITQAEDMGGLGTAAGLSGTFAHTQIEVGQYLAPNLFLAVMLRPLGGLQAGSQAQLPGARLEWRFTDTWSMEGFVEDRFAREGASGFGELGMSLSKIFGVSLYREWGY